MNSYDTNQLNRQQKINREKRNKTREQSTTKTITANKFYSDRTKAISSFGVFDNQGFEGETIERNDSYEKFSRHRNSRANPDIERYVPQKSPIPISQRLQVKSRNGYSSNSEDEGKRPETKVKPKQQHLQVNGNDRSYDSNLRPNKANDYDEDIIE